MLIIMIRSRTEHEYHHQPGCALQTSMQQTETTATCTEAQSRLRTGGWNRKLNPPGEPAAAWGSSIENGASDPLSTHTYTIDTPSETTRISERLTDEKGGRNQRERLLGTTQTMATHLASQDFLEVKSTSNFRTYFIITLPNRIAISV